jgi:hypothetical protein
MKRFGFFLKLMKDAFRDVLPVLLTIAFFQAVVIRQLPDDLAAITTGLLAIIIGLAIFLYGLEIGIFPLGESISNEFIRKGSLFWLLIFSFSLAFSISIAEPAIIAVAEKAQVISAGAISALSLRIVIAISVGLAIALGVLRIFLGHPVQYYIIPGYLLAIVITYFAPPEIVGLAFDSGGVATSIITVPVLAALAIGLSSFLKGRSPLIDGFGIIALAALAPIILVQLFGIAFYVFNGGFPATQLPVAAEPAREIAVSSAVEPGLLFYQFLSVARNIIPILMVIFFFQYVVIKRKIPHLRRVMAGFVILTIGLYLFLVGLDLALFPLGDTMAEQLTQTNSAWLIYAFSFLVGFSATLAEPALIAVANKASEISGGMIRPVLLRLFVAAGVAVGITLGTYRILHGADIHYFLIPGYILVVIVTLFAPRYIIPIAYDSGAVTTSEVTVPLITAFGVGLAVNTAGRDPLIDGFGLIAFASLFPIITVIMYGILTDFFTRRAESRA